MEICNLTLWRLDFFFYSLMMLFVAGQKCTSWTAPVLKKIKKTSCEIPWCVEGTHTHDKSNKAKKLIRQVFIPTLYFYMSKNLKIKLCKPSIQSCSYWRTLHKGLLKSVGKLLLMSVLSFTTETVEEATFVCVPKWETAFRFWVRNFTT